MHTSDTARTSDVRRALWEGVVAVSHLKRRGVVIEGAVCADVGVARDEQDGCRLARDGTHGSMQHLPSGRSVVAAGGQAVGKRWHSVALGGTQLVAACRTSTRGSA